MTATTTSTTGTTPVVPLRQRQQQQSQHKKHPKWTNTNSDERCLSDVQNPVARFLYVLSLKTGFYSIEPTDRRLSLLIFCFLMIVSSIMLYVFCQGVRDGFLEAAAASAMEGGRALENSHIYDGGDAAASTMMDNMNHHVASGQAAVDSMGSATTL